MGEGTGKLMRIGQVCTMLKDEFSDISISKLRFLEEQGLVEPERTPGGYRMYSSRDVEALRHILRMQRDEFLPLKVIREELQRRLGESGPSTVRRVGSTPGAVPGTTTRVSVSTPDELVALDQLVQRAQVSTEFVEECRQQDLVHGTRLDDGRVGFSLHECGLVQAAAIMQRLGVDLRHVRQVRSSVSRQAALVEQYAAAPLRNPNPEQREAALRSVETLTQALSDFIRLAFVRDVRQMVAESGGATGTGSGPSDSRSTGAGAALR